MIESPEINYISSDEEFAALCKRWQDCYSIAVDTEFMRTSTFYAKIGLLQIADEEEVYLIDPLEIRDWDGFRELLINSNCIIVVHSASEDLNLLLTHIGCLPKNLFDTQLAAAFLGLGFSLSYQALVEQQTGITVEKGETRSDWLRRPLSEKQLQYAANDVIYLLDIANTLRESLISKSKLEWFEAETKMLLKAAEQVEDEEYWSTLYAGISNAWRLSDGALRFSRRLCLWRETEARRRNRPRSWIVKDNDLQAIAVSAAEAAVLNEDLLRSVKVQEPKFIQRYASELSKILNDQCSDDAPLDRSILNYPVEGSDRKTLKALQRVVEEKAAQHQLAPELLGRKKQLLDVMKRSKQALTFNWDGQSDNWRQEILETEFSKLLKVES
jgi:ribonuclease D